MLGRSRLLAAAVMTATAIGVSCGDDGGGDDPSDALTEIVEQSFPDLDVSASCPSDASGRFDCDVTVGSEKVTVPVEEADGTLELRAALVNVGDVERSIETRYHRDEGGAASAGCTDNASDAVLVEKVGATFTCTVEPSSGSQSEATVTVENLDGEVSIEL
jgi:hypothetical protein